MYELTLQHFKIYVLPILVWTPIQLWRPCGRDSNWGQLGTIVQRQGKHRVHMGTNKLSIWLLKGEQEARWVGARKIKKLDCKAKKFQLLCVHQRAPECSEKIVHDQAVILSNSHEQSIERVSLCQGDSPGDCSGPKTFKVKCNLWDGGKEVMGKDDTE